MLLRIPRVRDTSLSPAGMAELASVPSFPHDVVHETATLLQQSLPCPDHEVLGDHRELLHVRLELNLLVAAGKLLRKVVWITRWAVACLHLWPVKDDGSTPYQLLVRASDTDGELFGLLVVDKEDLEGAIPQVRDFAFELSSLASRLEGDRARERALPGG